MKKSVFKFSPTTLIWRFQQKHPKRSSAISPRSSVLQIKVPVWASNPDLCKSMACKGTQVLACKSQQRMQCIGCVSSFVSKRALSYQAYNRKVFNCLLPGLEKSHTGFYELIRCNFFQPEEFSLPCYGTCLQTINSLNLHCLCLLLFLKNIFAGKKLKVGRFSCILLKCCPNIF